MKKSLSYLSLMASGLLAIGTPAFSAGEPHTITQRFDLTDSSRSSLAAHGIDFFFSDVPANQLTNGRDLSQFEGKTLSERLLSETKLGDFGPNGETFYQLTQMFDRLDARLAGQAIAYSNRSDDTDVNIQLKVGEPSSDKLKPNTTYLITARLDFISNASSSGFGVGGSPDSNSFGLIVTSTPWVAKVPSSATAPRLPVGSSPTDDALNNYHGLESTFFIDGGELSDLVDARFENLSAEDRNALGETTTEQKTTLDSLYQSVLAQLPSKDNGSALSLEISTELDSNIKDKLRNLSSDELQSIKEMFGLSTDPVLSASDSGLNENPLSAHIRTVTELESGRVVPLGVPSGSCTSGEPLANLDEDRRFVCERYSYMGRINSGLSDQAGVWGQNSITTNSPLEFTTDAEGSPIYLNLSSHSGFEGVSLYYITAIEYKLVEKTKK